jgi:hypothetical protein
MEGTGRGFSFLVSPATAITTCGFFAITDASGTVSVLTAAADGTSAGCGMTDQVSAAFALSNQ